MQCNKNKFNAPTVLLSYILQDNKKSGRSWKFKINIYTISEHYVLPVSLRPLKVVRLSYWCNCLQEIKNYESGITRLLRLYVQITFHRNPYSGWNIHTDTRAVIHANWTKTACVLIWLLGCVNGFSLCRGRWEATPVPKRWMKAAEDGK